MLGKLHCARHRERGASLAELALLIPVLGLLLAGALDLGRTLQSYVVIVNAAREGARYGSLNASDADGIKAAVIQEAGNSGVSVDPADITIDGLDGVYGSSIEVGVTHEVSMMLLGGLAGIDDIPLQAKAYMLIN